MDITEKDFRVLTKIYKNQKELVSYAKEFKISSPEDIHRLHSITRRGMVGFIADLFELIKLLNDDIKSKLSFNYHIIKQFRNTSTHQYDTINDSMVFLCLKHCIDIDIIKTIENLIKEHKNKD